MTVIYHRTMIQLYLRNKFGEFFVKKIELIKDSISNIQVNPSCSDTAAPAVKLDSF